MHGFVEELGIAFLVATALGLLVYRLGQPIILGYFISGIILGPEIGPPLIHDPENIEIVSEIGLILLLFVIGLEMNLPHILGAGRQLVFVGVGQFIVCVILGLAAFSALGYGFSGQRLDGLYLAVLCALSSTAIVVKLLYDKKELDTFSGRITLGVLVFQDIWAVLFLAFQPDLRNPDALRIIIALAKCLALVGASFLFGKFLLARLFKAISKSSELIVIASLGWCALVAAAAGALGLSKEMGALIAGVVIAAFPYSIFVCAKILPLRDFFLVLFFISLGMKIPYPTVDMVQLAALLGAIVLVTRFLSIYPILLASGSGRRTAFIASLNLSQLSEFSLVIAALGVSYGHISEDLMGTLIYTMAGTAILSSYMIQYSHQIYSRFSRLRPAKHAETTSLRAAGQIDRDYPIVILGFHRGARALVEEARAECPDLFAEMLVIDFNMEILRELESIGLAGIYGDVSHLDALAHAQVSNAEIILSTIPDMLLKGTTNLRLVEMCRSLNRRAFIAATADFSDQIESLIQAGADEVIAPQKLAAGRLLEAIRNRTMA